MSKPGERLLSQRLAARRRLRMHRAGGGATVSGQTANEPPTRRIERRQGREQADCLELEKANEETQTALAELKVAEEELHERNEALAAAHLELERERLRYLDLFENAPDGYLVTDAEGVIQQANRAAAELLNVPAESLRGKSLTLYVARESKKAYRRRLVEFKTLANLQDWELLLQPRNSQPVPVSLSVSVIPGDAVRPSHLNGEPVTAHPAKAQTLRWLLHDIRERKAAQDALQRANEDLEVEVATRTADLAAREKRIAEILESIADGFFAVDREWCFIYLNRRAAGSGDYEPEDLLGTNIWEVFPQLIGTPLETFYRQAMETGEAARFEQRSVSGERWYQINVFPSTEGISVYSQDITARKRAEAEAEAHQAALQALSIQHADARLRAEQMAWLAQMRLVENEAIFDALTDAVVVYNEAGRAVRANPAAVFAYGFDPVGTQGEEAAERLALQYPDGRAVPLESLPPARALKGQRVTNERYVFTNPGGDQLSFLVSSSPLRGLDGRIDGAVAIWHDITDLERAAGLQHRLMEESLHQRELLERLVQEAPVGIVVLDGPEHRIRLANPAFVALVGEDRARTGLTVMETWPDLPKPAMEMLDEVYRTGLPFFGEDLPFELENGESQATVYFTARFTPLSDTAGKVDGILSIVEDTTRRVMARRETETAYRQSEADRRTLQTLIENAPEGITLADADGRVILSNPAAERIYARPVPFGQPLETHAVMQIATPEGVPIEPRDLPLSRSALHGEIITNEEVMINWPDGQRRSLLVNSAPIRDPDGNLAGGVTVFQDITERKHLEDLLRWSQAAERARAGELEALMDAVPAMVLVAHDPKCRQVTGNRAAYQLLELPREANLSVTPNEADGNLLFELIAGGQPGEPGRLPLQIAASQGLVLQDVRQQVVLPGGKTLHLYGNIVPLLDETGQPRGAMAAFTDISRLVQAERALEEYTAQLEASHRELKDFAFIASHDLQEPLRKVLAFSDRLAKEFGPQLSSPGQDYLRRMQNATARMQEMILGLLEYSRIATRAQPFKRVDLREVAGQVISDLDVRLEQTCGRVEVGDLPVLEADPLQMRQLFQNLIANGLKFHREGVPPVVKVYARTTEDGGRSSSASRTTTNDDSDPSSVHYPSSSVRRPSSFIELVFEDNGIGLDEQFSSRLFQPFQRLVGRSEFEGSGMGLAICRKIIERHGGEINAYGELGQGAAIVVKLPVKQ